METELLQAGTRETANTEENKQTYSRHKIEDTPFTVVKTPEGCILTTGDYKVSQIIFENKEKAVEYINTKPWELLVTVINVVMAMNQRKF